MEFSQKKEIYLKSPRNKNYTNFRWFIKFTVKSSFLCWNKLFSCAMQKNTTNMRIIFAAFPELFPKSLFFMTFSDKKNYMTSSWFQDIHDANKCQHSTHSYSFNMNFSFQLYICDGCIDLLQKSLHVKKVAIVSAVRFMKNVN